MATRITTQSGFFHFSEQMSQMMDEMFRRYWRFSSTRCWQPTINIYETPQQYVICVDLAGMRREDIDVQIEQNRLVIQGKRPIPDPGSRADQLRIHLMEIDHGPFQRELEVPGDVDAAGVTAKYRDGMLWIELPKKPA